MQADEKDLYKKDIPMQPNNSPESPRMEAAIEAIEGLLRDLPKLPPAQKGRDYEPMPNFEDLTEYGVRALCEIARQLTRIADLYEFEMGLSEDDEEETDDDEQETETAGFSRPVKGSENAN